MKIGITHRLFLSILGATCLAVLSLFLIMRWTVDREFYRYLGTIDQTRLEQITSELGRRYEKHGNWKFLETEVPRMDIAGIATPPERDTTNNAGEGEAGQPSQPRFIPRSFHHPGRLIVLDADRKPLLGAYPGNEEVNFRPVFVSGRIVGYAGLLSPKHFLHPIQLRFLREQKFALSLAAAGMVLAVMIISFPLARRLVKPIKAMAAATHEIASGRYATRVPALSSDELGKLARDFNEMALTLQKHEAERRNWVADISHELRTPIAVLRGEIEALLDGIRTVTPETVRSLHAEVLRLNRLVEDLYQLSLSDISAMSYRKENLDLVQALSLSLDAYRVQFQNRSIAMNVAGLGSPIVVFADRQRLAQLFTNLLENCLRYTDQGGTVDIRVAVEREQAIIEFHDSKPGVPDEDLPRLFDRLYRVEGSRSRSSGGAGLGLTISKHIVEAHQGTISAHHSPLGGLLIRIALPSSGALGE